MKVTNKKVEQLIEEGVLYAPMDGNHGEMHPKTSDYVEKGVPFILVPDLVDGLVDLDNCNYISVEQAQTLRKGFSKTGDVLFTHKATIGKVALVDTKEYEYIILTPQVTYYRIKNNEVLYNEYLYYYFQSHTFQETFRLFASSGGTRDYLGIVAQQKLPIIYPDIEVQKDIVAVLKNYDNLIHNNNKRIKILEQMAENLYKEWFMRFRFPGHEEVEFEGGIPKGWLKTELENVLSKITTGLNPRSNFSLGEGENYYVTIKNMGDNNIFLDDKCDRVNDEAIIKINKRSDLQHGDILFSGIGTIGRTYLVCIPTDNWNVSESVFTLRANDKITKEYLYMLLLSDDVQNYCNQHAQGVAQKGIRMGELKSMKIFLPPSELIVRFTEIVEPIIRNQQILRQEIVNLTKQRDLLLPRLMGGKLEMK